MVEFTIATRGVKSAPLVMKEFAAGIEQELAKHLPSYATATVSKMQANAPVRTGYLRNNIRSHFETPAALSINAWAPYSGFVNYGNAWMPPRPFFTQEVEQGPQVLNTVFGQASVNFLKQIISKHQNGP